MTPRPVTGATESSAATASVAAASAATISTAARMCMRTYSSLRLACVLVPVHGPGGEQVRAERATEHPLDLARAFEQGVEVDPGLEPHLVQHRHEVLGRHVARRARRNGAAAELPER